MRIYAPCFEEPHTDTGKLLVCWVDGGDAGEIWYGPNQWPDINPALIGAE
jgi:hypothetical protein